MDLRHLRTFVAVAEQGTVSKAALRLRIAQPALSRQIGDLERELGLRLFDRVRQRLVLTAEGEQMLLDCRKVLAAVGVLGERAQLLQREEIGVLKVAATPQMIDGVFSEFLHHFAALRPNIKVRLIESLGEPMLAMLERGELHLGISLIGAIDTERHELGSMLLAPLEFLACCTPSLSIGNRGEIEITRLAGVPLLLPDTSFFVRQQFDAACRLAGLRPDVFLESRTPHALLALAEAGHGVAVVPSVLPTRRYELKVSRITHHRRPLREPLAALWHRQRVLPGYADDFCRSLADYMRAVFPISRPSGQARVSPPRARR